MSTPQYLYKYRSLAVPSRETTERILTHNELYFAAPHEFNDPFESRFLLSLDGSPEQRLNRIADLYIQSTPALTHDAAIAHAADLLLRLPQDVNHTVEQHLIEKFRTRFAILSLAERPSDVLLWSHYADSHRGVCVQLDCKAWHKLLSAFKVTYSEDLPTLHWVTSDSDEALRVAALTKSTLWQYEDEWRILDFRQGAGVQRYPPEALSGIVVGLETPPDDRQRLRALCANRARPVKFFQARRQRDKYALDIVPLP